MNEIGNRRAVSSMVGAIILVLVVVIAGSIAAFGLSSGTTGTTITRCAPANSPVCIASAANHNINLLVPEESSLIGASVPFTASLPTGESASEFTFNFGDGSSPQTISGSAQSATASYTYSSPGTYLIQVSAEVNGVLHDNLHDIGYLVVQPTYAVPSAELVPTVTSSMVSNTTSTTAPTGVVGLAGTVTVSGEYTATPINAAYTAAAPSVAILTGPAGGASITSQTLSGSTAMASFLFGAAGTYTVAFTANAVGPAGTASQNYTYTVIAGSGGAASVPPFATDTNQPGTIISYANTGGSAAETLDPAIDYESIGYEPIQNVYQTLVQYNETSVANFVPMAAACVPGSAECSSLFGQNLTVGYNYTYVLSGASNFYDKATGAHWGVYPTDVVFSFARAASFATLPSWGGNNGWVQAQSFLPLGNASWDVSSLTGSGIHAKGNNTPYQIFTHLLVNDSAFCPAAAYGVGYHGCVTVVADGLGQAWTPAAVDQLLTDGLGGSITPAGWVNAQESTTSSPDALPGWNISTADSGDHPVTLPGDSNPYNASSNDPGFQSWLNWVQANPDVWDAMQIDGSGVLGTYPSSSITDLDTMSGSGPYYLSYFDNGVEYTLKANPYYSPNPDCLASTSCQPARNHYAGNVTQNWENGVDPGIAAIEAGRADVAAWVSTDNSLLLQLVAEGKVKLIQYPTIGVYFYPFDWNFNLASAQALTPTTITAPTDFFSSEAMRMFFSTAYPYESIYKAILDVDGIVAGSNYGGAIAPGMQYYPTNVTWPSADPSVTSTASTPGTAWWWWAQVTNTSSPYFDAQIATDCSSATPCTIPIFGQTGNPPGDIQNALWVAQVNKISGGAIHAILVDVPFLTLVIGSIYSSPGNSPLSVYTLGWSPDYPAPSDYITPLWAANSTYTFADSVEQSSAAYASEGNVGGGTVCPGASDFGAWAAFAQNNPGIPQACEGTAYQAMLYGNFLVSHTSNTTDQALWYAMISQIGRALGLYVYQYESVGAWNVAPWINTSSMNTQLTSSDGGLDDLFYQISGNGLY
ncbi:MAG: PKD domain-containing protein [Thermoplasmata archaeon]